MDLKSTQEEENHAQIRNFASYPGTVKSDRS